jgi:hypothetical protein
MNEEAYHNGSGTDLWIRSDQIWYPELQMRSMNVWDMTVSHLHPFGCLAFTHIPDAMRHKYYYLL